MTETSVAATWCVTPRDPLIIRDGRPFGVNSGRRMKSLNWPLPSMMAGCLRTAIGREWGADFGDQEFCDALKQISVHGPLPFANNQLYFPAPADAICDAQGDGRRQRPEVLEEGEGIDGPFGLRPVLPDADLVGSKFGVAPAWWSRDAFVEWLTTATDQPVTGFFTGSDRFLQSPEQDQRTHVSIDPQSSSASDGMLFATSGLVLDQMLIPGTGDRSGTPVSVQLAMRLRSGSDRRLPTDFRDWLTVGGERRVAQVESVSASPQEPWSCPEEVIRAMNESRRWRLVLATPALFENGWYPGWLTNEQGCLVGACENLPAMPRLKLVSVCSHRWRPVSGWQFERPAGPKPVRRMMPAGSVLFFERQDDTPFDPALWLASVSDAEQDRRDGFGLAAWGVW